MIGFDSSGPLAGDCWQNRRPTPLIPANSPPAARCSRLTGLLISIKRALLHGHPSLLISIKRALLHGHPYLLISIKRALLHMGIYLY